MKKLITKTVLSQALEGLKAAAKPAKVVKMAIKYEKISDEADFKDSVLEGVDPAKVEEASKVAADGGVADKFARKFVKRANKTKDDASFVKGAIESMTNEKAQLEAELLAYPKVKIGKQVMADKAAEIAAYDADLIDAAGKRGITPTELATIAGNCGNDAAKVWTVLEGFPVTFLDGKLAAEAVIEASNEPFLTDKQLAVCLELHPSLMGAADAAGAVGVVGNVREVKATLTIPRHYVIDPHTIGEMKQVEAARKIAKPGKVAKVAKEAKPAKVSKPAKAKARVTRKVKTVAEKAAGDLAVKVEGVKAPRPGTDAEVILRQLMSEAGLTRTSIEAELKELRGRDVRIAPKSTAERFAATYGAGKVLTKTANEAGEDVFRIA